MRERVELAVTAPPKKAVPEVYWLPWMESLVIGELVPIPTRPPLSTMKLVAVDEPITNDGIPAPRAFGLTDRRPHGVVVAIPTLPFVVAK